MHFSMDVQVGNKCAHSDSGRAGGFGRQVVRNGDAVYGWAEDKRGKADHTVVDAEDALIAALKVKMQRPAAEILYVRRANRRGDARNPAHALKKER